MDNVFDAATTIVYLYFGQLSGCLVAALLRRGLCSMADLVAITGQPRTKIRFVLANLIRHRIVRFQTLSNSIRYSVDLPIVFQSLKYSEFGFLAEKRFGLAGRIIVMTVALNGTCTKQFLLDKLTELSVEADLAENTFNQMVNECFVYTTTIAGTELFHLNFDQFEHIFYLHEFVSSHEHHFGSEVASLVRAITELDSNYEISLVRGATRSFTSHQIYSCLSDPPFTVSEVGNALSCLAEDSSSQIEMDPNSQAKHIPSYQLNTDPQLLYEAHLQSFLMGKYGNDSVKIVNVIRQEECLKKDQIEQLALVEVGTTSKLLSAITRDGIVRVREYPRFKTNDLVSNKCDYFFKIDEASVANRMLRSLYQSIGNMIDFVRFLVDSTTAAGKIALLLKKEAEIEKLKSGGANECDLPDGEKRLLNEFWTKFRKLKTTCSALGSLTVVFERFLKSQNKRSPLNNN